MCCTKGTTAVEVVADPGEEPFQLIGQAPESEHDTSEESESSEEEDASSASFYEASLEAELASARLEIETVARLHDKAWRKSTQIHAVLFALIILCTCAVCYHRPPLRSRLLPSAITTAKPDQRTEQEKDNELFCDRECKPRSLQCKRSKFKITDRYISQIDENEYPCYHEDNYNEFLAVGDEILSVNGIDARELNEAQIRALMFTMNDKSELRSGKYRDRVRLVVRENRVGLAAVKTALAAVEKLEMSIKETEEAYLTQQKRINDEIVQLGNHTFQAARQTLITFNEREKIYEDTKAIKDDHLSKITIRSEAIHEEVEKLTSQHIKASEELLVLVRYHELQKQLFTFFITATITVISVYLIVLLRKSRRTKNDPLEKNIVEARKKQHEKESMSTELEMHEAQANELKRALDRLKKELCNFGSKN